MFSNTCSSINVMHINQKTTIRIAKVLLPVKTSLNIPLKMTCAFISALLLIAGQNVLAEEHSAYDANNEIDHFEDDLADFYGDDDFVSIATGSKQLISKAPSTATVITAQDIKNMAALDIDEVLESVPGLHVSYYTNSHLPLYTFRGINSTYNPQVLMLINGVPITNIFTGNRSNVWGGMTVEAIARIEVIRGPGSALFGADATAGVINIITKTAATSNGTNTGIRAGNFDTQDYWLNHRFNIGDLGGFISYERHETDGYEQYIEADYQSFLDVAFGTSASHAPGYANQFRKNDEFRLNLDYNHFIFNLGYQKRRMDDGIGVVDALGPETKISSARWNSDITYNTESLFDDWQLSAKFAYFDTSQEMETNLYVFPPGSDIGLGGPFPDGVIGNPEVFERHYRTGATVKYTALADHNLTLGLGYDIVDMYKVQESKNFALGPNGEFLAPGSPIVDVTDTPYIFIPEDDRKNAYLFVQDLWQVAQDWQLTAGVRYDDYSDFGSTVNPRLALVWSSTLNLTTKFLYGSAFRAPSFTEMRSTNNPANVGNPDLDPETIDTYELAFNYQTHTNLSYGLNFFTYNWQDIIEFTPDEGATTTTAQNIGEQQGYGVELEFTWTPLDDLDLSGNYTWLNAEDVNNNDVSAIPEQQIYVQANYDLTEHIHFNVKSNWVLDRMRAAGDTRDPVDDYNMTDLSLSWQPKNTDLSVAVIVKNIFDADAREPTPNGIPVPNVPHDLPLTGRASLIQLTYHLD